MNDAVGSLRGTLAWLERQEELIRISKSADPIVEIPALVKKLETGPALLFEQLKGYPDRALVANIVWSS